MYSNSTKNGIKNLDRARLLARQAIKKYNIRYPINLYYVAHKLDVEIYQTKKLPRQILGSVKLSGDKIWIITINSNQINSRQRFSIAHEMGHILLHHDQAGYQFIDIIKKQDQLCERQANVFASELLMPAEEFKNIYFNHNITNPADIANYFQVSMQAAEIRISEIIGTGHKKGGI